MTEEKAKTKWCPMTFNSPPEEISKCIASDCMMWTKTMIQRVDDNGDQYIDTEDGRCGLAK
jgi:hypothetical protein